MAKNLLSCPFSIKMLMNFYGKGLKKDGINLAEILRIKEKFACYNKLFLLSSVEICSKLIKTNFNVQTAQFESNEDFIIAIRNWLQQYGRFQQFTPDNYISGKGLLINVCMYKGTWNSQEGNLMTVYNSFSYTEDIKYEPRILVVPMNDEGVLLAIVVPKENDESRGLAVELKEQGLAAALNCIKPVFTVTSKQSLPIFAFESTIELQGPMDETMVTQYGEIRTDKSGIDVKVLTCLPVKDDNLNVDYRRPPSTEKCLNFAIVYQDIPIFTGQVLP